LRAGLQGGLTTDDARAAIQQLHAAYAKRQITLVSARACGAWLTGLENEAACKKMHWLWVNLSEFVGLKRELPHAGSRDHRGTSIAAQRWDCSRQQIAKPIKRKATTVKVSGSIELTP